MQYAIKKDPSYAMVEITLDEGEQIETKPGVMMDRTGGIGVQSDLGGDGVTGTLGRMVSSSKGLIENTYHAHAGGEQLTLVPEDPGDVVPLNVGELGELRVQSGGLVAWEPLVQRSSDWNNPSNILSSGEFRVLSLSGRGTAFLSSFGGMVERQVTQQRPLVVDEDHLVAWTAGMNLNRQKDGSIKSTVLGGEGYVTEFRGNGTVWLQTRDPSLLHRGGGHEGDDSSDGVGVDDFL